MTNPTPEEITAALAVLRRVPGVRDIDSIGVIERKNAPIWRMTRELNELAVATDLTPVVLAEVAARHGLCITTDPEPAKDAAVAELRHAASLLDTLDGLTDGSAVIDRNGVMWQRWTTPGLSTRWWAHAPTLSNPSGGQWSEGSGRWTAAALVAQRGSVRVIHVAPEGGKA